MLISTKHRKKDVSSKIPEDLEETLKRKEGIRKEKGSDGRARRYLVNHGGTHDILPRTDHSQLQLRRQEHAAALLNRVLEAIPSENGVKELAGTATGDMMAKKPFEDVAVTKIKEDKKNFESTNAFITHVESKLVWLLKELGETDERLTTLQDKYDRLRIEFQVVTKEREEFLHRIDAMKEVLMERAATYQASVDNLKRMLDQKEAETRNLKSRMHKLSNQAKRDGAAKAKQEEEVEVSINKGSGVYIPTHDWLASTTGSDCHADIIKSSAVEHQIEESKIGILQDDIKKLQIQLSQETEQHNIDCAKLRKEKEKTQKELERDRKAAHKEHEDFLQDLEQQITIQLNLREEVAQLTQQLNDMKQHNTVLETQVGEISHKYLQSAEANDNKLTQLKEHYNEVHEDKASLFVALEKERESVARLTAEKEFIMGKHQELQTKFNRTLQRLGKVQNVCLAGPAAVQLLQKMEHTALQLTKTDSTTVFQGKGLMLSNPNTLNNPSKLALQDALMSAIDPELDGKVDPAVVDAVAQEHRKSNLPNIRKALLVPRRAVPAPKVASPQPDEGNEEPTKDISTQTGCAGKLTEGLETSVEHEDDDNDHNHNKNASPHSNEINDKALLSAKLAAALDDNRSLKAQLSSVLTGLTKFPFMQQPPTLLPRCDALEQEKHQLELVIDEMHRNNKELLEKNRDLQDKMLKTLERGQIDKRGWLSDKTILTDKADALKHTVTALHDDLREKKEELQKAYKEIEMMHSFMDEKQLQVSKLKVLNEELERTVQHERGLQTHHHEKRGERLRQVEASLKATKEACRVLRKQLKDADMTPVAGDTVAE